MSRRASSVVVLLLLGIAAAEDAKTTFHIFAKGGGRPWRGGVPSLVKPSLEMEAEGGPGTLSFDGTKEADHYVAYLFDRRPVLLKKDAEEEFWKGDSDHFVIGVEVTPAPGAKSFAIADPNAARRWGVAYVFAVEGKDRKLIPATWTKDKLEGVSLPERYRVKEK